MKRYTILNRRCWAYVNKANDRVLECVYECIVEWKRDLYSYSENARNATDKNLVAPVQRAHHRIVVVDDHSPDANTRIYNIHIHMYSIRMYFYQHIFFSIFFFFYGRT